MSEEQLADLPSEVLSAYIKARDDSSKPKQSQTNNGKPKWRKIKETRVRCHKLAKKVASVKYRSLFIRGGGDQGHACAKAHTWGNKQVGIDEDVAPATLEQLFRKEEVLQSYYNTHS